LRPITAVTFDLAERQTKGCYLLPGTFEQNDKTDSIVEVFGKLFQQKISLSNRYFSRKGTIIERIIPHAQSLKRYRTSFLSNFIVRVPFVLK
jgi:hypothetical protein